MHPRIIAGLAMIATIGIIAIMLLTIAMGWATVQARDRAACYRTATTVDACSKPSFAERALAHYIAHVDM